MNKYEHIKRIFTASIEAKRLSLETLVEPIAKAADIMIKALSTHHKILSCGNGGSAADAQHFAAEMIGRFLIEREPLAAIALSTDTSVLTAIANDYNYDDIFSKQIIALGDNNDVLLAISTSGNSVSIIKAIEAAHEKGMKVIALTGKNGGKMAHALNANDLELRVTGPISPRIQETHILIIHCLCELIENQLFTEQL